MPVSTYPVDETTIDIRDLQRMPTTGLIEADDSPDALDCTGYSCRFIWTQID